MEGTAAGGPPAASRAAWLDDHRVGLLGSELSSLGIPFFATLLSAVGMTLPNGFRVLPFLWLAPPFLLRNLHRVSTAASGTTRILLQGAQGAGLAAWLVALWATLVGPTRLTEISEGAFSLALVAYCAGLASLTASLGWPSFVRRWHGALAAIATATLGSVVLVTVLNRTAMQTGSSFVDRPGWLLAPKLAITTVYCIAVFLLSRIHRATWSAMSEDARTGPSGPIQQQ